MRVVKASVVICARNRRADMLDAIGSLERQSLPRDGYEIVVVDNASTDGSLEAAREHAMTSPGPFAVVVEPRVGISWARNTGIARSRGEIVAFIDSDAIADESWLGRLCEAFEDEQVVCAGGPVRLRFEGARPRGLPEVDQLRLSACDQGPLARDIRFPAWICGTNIAFRRSVFDAVGTFRTQLGRCGGRPTAAEETELCIRIERAGGRMRWVPGAAVLHRIRPARLELPAILRTAYWEGFSFGLVHRWHEGILSQEGSVRYQMAGLRRESGRTLLLRRQAILPAILANRLRGQLDGYLVATGGGAAQAPPSEARSAHRRLFRFVREARRRSLPARAARLIRAWLRTPRWLSTARPGPARGDGTPGSAGRGAAR